MEWVEPYFKVRARIFIKSNIEGGWRGPRLSPFNPQKVLRKVISIPSMGAGELRVR